MGGIIAYCSYYLPKFRSYFEDLSKTVIVAVYSIGFLFILFEKSIFVLPFLQVISRLLYSFFFAFILLEQNYSRRSFYKMKNWKRLTHWGRMTYGLYCLHFLGILAAIVLSQKMGWNESLIGVLIVETALAFAITWCIAWVSYRYFEMPFLKLKFGAPAGKPWFMMKRPSSRSSARCASRLALPLSSSSS